MDRLVAFARLLDDVFEQGGILDRGESLQTQLRGRVGDRAFGVERLSVESGQGGQAQRRLISLAAQEQGQFGIIGSGRERLQTLPQWRAVRIFSGQQRLTVLPRLRAPPLVVGGTDQFRRQRGVANAFEGGATDVRVVVAAGDLGEPRLVRRQDQSLAAGTTGRSLARLQTGF